MDNITSPYWRKKIMK